jgi:hypothetical protein
MRRSLAQAMRMTLQTWLAPGLKWRRRALEQPELPCARKVPRSWRRDCVAQRIPGMIRDSPDIGWKAPIRVSDFRNRLFLKFCSLFFRLVSVSFQRSQHAGQPAKDGITEK